MLPNGGGKMKITVKDTVEFQKIIMMVGHSIRSLAKESELSHGYVSQIISGDRHPGPKTAKKLAETLNKEFDDIFFIQGGNKSEQKKNKSA